MDTIDLSDVAEGEVVSATFSVEREAGFDNTVDFYEVNLDGSVVDPVSGAIIAPGEAGYTDAALANRVGLELKTDNGVTSEFLAELEGGKQYAPLIAIDSAIEPLTDDLTVYFTYSEANPDSFDHVRNTEANIFEFEDFASGGDADFNDMVVNVSLDGDSVTQTPTEELTEQPTIDGVIFATNSTSPLSIQALDTTVENNQFSFDSAGTDSSGFFSIVDVDLDISGGIASRGSIAFEVDESSTTGDSIFSLEDLSLYRFVLPPGEELPVIASVTLRDSDNSLGLESSDIIFTEDFISVDVEGLLASRGTAVLDIEFADV